MRLTWYFPGQLYVDMLPAEVSSPLEFFPVCRGRMPADNCVEPSCHGPVEAQTCVGTRIMKPAHNLVDEKTFIVVSQRRATQNDPLPSD
ncbi:hypothetical protein ACWCQZ_35100 [Streptomyces sp. NPDC002285]